MEACSKALEENRGIYSGISERTIREDIRVMRSDILGFNAPIAQKDGHYFYEDRSYSIFKVNIRESELLGRVLNFIRQIQSEIQHPDMEDIIERISLAISKHEEPGKPAPDDDTLMEVKSNRMGEPQEDELFMEESAIFGTEDLKDPESTDIFWALILNLI
jgi:hypothetical protein